MNLVWQTAADHRDAAVQALRDAGADVRERRGFEPVTTIVAVAGAMIIVRAVAGVFRDARYRGVLIDLTKDPVEIREMPGWDRSQVLIIGPEGPQFHQFTTEDGLAALISAVKA